MFRQNFYFQFSHFHSVVESNKEKVNRTSSTDLGIAHTDQGKFEDTRTEFGLKSGQMMREKRPNLLGLETLQINENRETDFSNCGRRCVGQNIVSDTIEKCMQLRMIRMRSESGQRKSVKNVNGEKLTIVIQLGKNRQESGEENVIWDESRFV